MRAAHFALLSSVLAAGCGRFNFDQNDTGTDAGSVFPGGSPTVRTRLDLDRYAPSEPLVDFPLLVTLDDTRADRTLFGVDASDVRFRDETGAIIAHEIEAAGSPGGDPFTAWVRVPRYEVGTSIYVEYGGTPAPASTDAVWSASYEAVWHFKTADIVLDSTAHHRDATAHHSVQSDPGFVSQGIQLDDTDSEYLSAAGDTGNLTEITVSGWILANARSRSSSGYSDIVTREYLTDTTDDVLLGLAVLDVPALDISTNGGAAAAIGPATTFGEWQLLTGTWTAGVSRIYVNGAFAGMHAVAGDYVRDSQGNPFFIGAGNNNTIPREEAMDDFVNGRLDEIRIENVVRSDAWIRGDYLSASDAVTTYGPIDRL
ncbi:MAG TPA: LamG-like jellyroll fold domain-containing protein [Kofleriaceae bacterium]|jgi:hypothetical protein